MPSTLAILVTMTTYGTWLRGDRRGWVDDGEILPPKPLLEAADRELKRKADFGNLVAECLLIHRLEQSWS